MVRLLTLLILLSLVTVPAAAQSSAGPSTSSSSSPAAADSLRAVQDSVLTSAMAIVARDSSATDEFEKIVSIYKARKRFALQLQAATAMAAANPRSALAHLSYGDALLDNDLPERALEELLVAVSLQPTYVKARVILAETFEILHKPDSALAHLDTALLHNPRHAQAHMQRAKLLMRRGRTSEAAAHYRTACELLPDAPSSYGPWMKLAEALVAIYAFDEAISALRYCIRLRPEHPDAYLVLAETFEKAGRAAEAITAYTDFAHRFAIDDRALDAERAALRLRYPGTTNR